jgi:type II secretory pathway predicted ATPase ExeA
MNDPFDKSATLERANVALIRYPRFKELHEEIQLCQRLSKIASEPQCMSLEGQTGTGKTTLIRAYASSFPATETEQGTRITVLYMEVPSPVGIKDFASAALRELGDPAFEKGTRASMTMRLGGLINDCGIEFVILDDFHHLIDMKTNRILAEVSDWLKYLIKKTGVPFLVVGIEGKVEIILRANPQLSRLFATRETLEPFAWNTNEQATIQIFSHFVGYVEQAVEKSLSNEIPRMDLLYRIHYATDGVVGNVMNLMRAASVLSEIHGNDNVDLAMLSLAYKKRLQKHLNNRFNPFSETALSRSTLPYVEP